MEWSFIWKTILIILVGTALLRIAGKKSVSQLTIAQTVIMVSIGTLLIQPVVGKSVWFTFLIAATMIGTLLLMEYAQLKVDTLEKIITGKAKVLIEDGQPKVQTLSKLRMTVDQLEMKLRQKNVSKIGDVKTATLEPNGQLGFELKEEARPATKKDLQQLSQQLNMSLNTVLANQTSQLKNQQLSLNSQLNVSDQQASNNQSSSKKDQQDIFKEVERDGHNHPPPKYLQ